MLENGNKGLPWQEFDAFLAIEIMKYYPFFKQLCLSVQKSSFWTSKTNFVDFSSCVYYTGYKSAGYETYINISLF